MNKNTVRLQQSYSRVAKHCTVVAYTYRDKDIIDTTDLRFQTNNKWTRSHNMTLINKTKHVNDSDFIVRMLYKYSY